MGLVSSLCSLLKLYALLYGAWTTFKLLKNSDAGDYNAAKGEKLLRFWAVLSGLHTYELYLEWAVSFWLPFYYEVKLGSLIWLVMPGSSAPEWLFTKWLHPLISVLAFHWQRDVRPRLASVVLQAVRRLQGNSLPALINAVRRDELKMWDRSVRGQLASVQMELEKRRVEGQHLADQRLPDPDAAALLAFADASHAQLLREVLEPSSAASANGGICGGYKRGQAAVVKRDRDSRDRRNSTAPGSRRASSVSRVRFATDSDDEKDGAVDSARPATASGVPLPRAGRAGQAQAQSQADRSSGIAMVASPAAPNVALSGTTAANPRVAPSPWHDKNEEDMEWQTLPAPGWGSAAARPSTGFGSGAGQSNTGRYSSGATQRPSLGSLGAPVTAPVASGPVPDTSLDGMTKEASRTSNVSLRRRKTTGGVTVTPAHNLVASRVRLSAAGDLGASGKSVSSQGTGHGAVSPVSSATSGPGSATSETFVSPAQGTPRGLMFAGDSDDDGARI